MRLTIARLLLLTPVLAMLVSCVCPRSPLKLLPDRTVIAKGPRAVYVKVEARFDANGIPSFGDYHDTELVRPGDAIEFRCKCAPGLEFRVSEPRLVANKDAFWDELLQRNPEAAREQVRKAQEWLERLRNSEGALENAEEARQWKADRPGSNGAGELRPPMDFLTEFLASFQNVIPELPEAQLFFHWEDPNFHPGGAAIGPFEVATMGKGQAFASTWKFTWTIRAAGEQDPSKWVALDPHIEWEPFHKTY